MTQVPEAELNQLEEVILAKVQQRVPSRMGEDTYLVKAFKYHDLLQNGWVDFDKFKRTLAPFTPGVSDQDLRLIFDRYAPDGSLHYKVFSSEFVSGSRRALPLGGEAAFDQACESPEEALTRMRDFLWAQGPRAVIGLATSFREADPENSRVVGQEMFHAILGDHFSAERGCPIEDMQIAQIFHLFLQPFAPGQIAYDEFLQALKDEPLPPERRAAVRAAFRRLDTSAEGLVDMHKMTDSFNAGRHPQVSDGTRQADEVLKEFAETMHDAVAFRRGQRAYPTNLVAWEEFEDYYKFVSGSFGSDALFCAILQRVWDLDKVPDQTIEARAALARPAAGVPGKARAGLHHWQSDTLPTNPTHNKVEQAVNMVDILGRARQQIARRGLRAAVDVVKNLYAADDDVDDLLDVYDFRKACQQSGIKLRETEEAVVFQSCAAPPPSSGALARRGNLIQVDKFLRLLHGALTPQRFRIIERVWLALGGDPNNESSTVSPTVLKENFFAETHPLVVKGELDPGVVLAEFLDTFSLLAHIRGGCPSGMVTFADFLAYYDLVSSTVESDALFDLLMHRLWPMPDDDAEAAKDAAEAAAEDAAPVVSPRRWATPVVEVRDNPVPRARPPAHTGPSAYARASPRGEQAASDTHRRFARIAPGPLAAPAPALMGDAAAGARPLSATAPAAGFSAITKSSIVFNEAVAGELGGVIGRLRDNIARRGLKGWKLLSERFQQHDNKRNGTVMRLDWQRLHKGLGLGLSPEEQDVIYKHFSANRRDCAMDYRQCLAQTRGRLTEKRSAMVSRLFEDLCDHSGRVPVAALKSSYDAKSAPVCLVARKDAYAEAQDFFESVDHFAAGQAALDAEAFEELFAMLSCVYKEEDEFRLAVTAAFGLPGGGASVGGG